MKKIRQLIDTDTEQLIQALELHQVELEMQNQELKLAKGKADMATDKYAELYDFAPCGYFTLSPDGEIIELNLYGSQMLGRERKYLLDCRLGLYISDQTRPIFNRFLETVFNCHTQQTCEVIFSSKDQSILFVHLSGILVEQRGNCLVTAIDISERNQSRLTLQESETRLEKAQKIAHLGSWEFDFRSGALIWSQEVYRIFGLEPDEFNLTYEGFLELVYPEDRETINSTYLGSVEQNRDGYENEHRIIRRNTGEIRFVYEKCEHIRDASGKIIRSFGMIQDITERKLTENTLIENEEKFRNFIQCSSDPIFSFNRDETYRFANDAFARPFGKNPLEIIGKTPYEIFPYDEAEKRLEIVRKVLKTGEKGEIEVDVVDPSGESRYFLTTADAVKNDQNQVVYVNCVSKEITQLKNAEQALKESEAQISALLAAMPDMIFILNREGIFIDYHGPLSTELYATPDSFIGRSMFDVLPEDIVNQFFGAFEAAFRTGEVQLCEYSMTLPSGRQYFESKVVAFDRDKILTIIRNVSLYKDTEELIKIKNSDLQRINAEKDKFFSIIAHDLRSPFSGFLGLTESMAKKLPNMTLNEIQHITLLMHNSAAHLFRLLGNLLEWSKMERGLTLFQPKTFVLMPKISDSLIFAKEMANNKKIIVRCKIPLNLKVFADENMFESIFRNLMSNAVKYTPKGGRITVTATKNSNRSVEISVSDTGIGMSKKLIDHLFRLDTQSNRKGTEGEYSSGLGLIICRDFIEKHGGTLSVESLEGKGSTFRFTLPEQNEILN